MTLRSDLRVLYNMVVHRGRGADHAERLRTFYGPQARDYDDYRRRLLSGREEMYQSIPVPRGGVWVDLGGGTGQNLENLGAAIHEIGRIYIVDLAEPLLDIARERIDRLGWTNVTPVLADATQFQPEEFHADVVTFSYSLTMIPDWFAAIDNASQMLREGGYLGAVDFYVSRKHPTDNLRTHSWPTRVFWPTWLATDNVFPSPDHLPLLRRRFETVKLVEGRGKMPYMPLVRVPYYIFVGRQRGESTANGAG